MVSGIPWSGSDVRIAEDGRVWVVAPAGTAGSSARWLRVELAEIELDTDFPDCLITRFGRHPMTDAKLDLREASHLLGLPRRDPARARELWSSRQFVRSGPIVLDLEARELAVIEESPEPPKLVYPFSAFRAVRLEPPALLLKVHRPGQSDTIALGDYVIPPTGLARAMQVALEPAGGGR